jgi:hypothetical protein
MKKQNHHNTRSKITVLHQLCNLIPPFLVPRLARETGVDKRARTFSPWSHVVTLLFAQVARSCGLNDVCDALSLHQSQLGGIRGASASSRNNLSHANKCRDSQMGERLFWNVLEQLQKARPGFGTGQRHSGAGRRFRRTIHAVDSTVVQLVLSCISWAKHRRRKAAAKLHLRMDIQTHLPKFAISNTANEHDSRQAAVVCAGVRSGEIVVFDRAYKDLRHLWQLTQQGVFWVTRTLERQDFRVVKRRLKKAQGRILRDDVIRLQGPKSKELYPEKLRRVLALIPIDGPDVELEFLTNNLDWQPSSVADLYRCRWEIEVFFRQLKQTLQLSDFLGNSLNAVQWQLWMALLVYVLLKYLAYVSRWQHSFIRVWTTVRAVVWERWDLQTILRRYGTARSSLRLLPQPHQLYFPCF